MVVAGDKLTKLASTLSKAPTHAVRYVKAWVGTLLSALASLVILSAAATMRWLP